MISFRFSVWFSNDRVLSGVLPYSYSRRGAVGNQWPAFYCPQPVHLETKAARSLIGQRSGCLILNTAYAVIALPDPRHWRLGCPGPGRRLRLDDSSGELLRTNSARPVDAVRNPKYPFGFR